MKKEDENRLKIYLEMTSLFEKTFCAKNNPFETLVESIEWSAKGNNEDILSADIFKKSRDSLIGIKNNVEKLEKMLVSYLEIGSKYKFAIDALNKIDIKATNDDPAEDLLKELPFFKNWCYETIENLKPKKTGRRTPKDGFLLIMMFEISHYLIFSKKGPLTPDGYHVITIKEALNRNGIYISVDGVKNRIRSLRRSYSYWDVLELKAEGNEWFGELLRQMLEKSLVVSHIENTLPDDYSSLEAVIIENPEILKTFENFQELLAKIQIGK